MTENHNIRKIEAFELDRTTYFRYVDKCNSNNFVWMKVDRADPETDLEIYNLLEKLSVESKEYPSYCCPKCGEEIGWIGRFFQFLRVPLHRCKDTP